MMSDDFVVGNETGWHLAFATPAAAVVAFGSGDYDAAIVAALPDGLDAGTYRFTIEGITNDHYERLHQAWSGGGGALRADLSLYWRDTGGALRGLANLAGLDDAVAGGPPEDALVARLAVTRLSRRAGSRRFEAYIEAREAVYDALARRLDQQPAPASDLVGTALAVAKALGVDAVPHPPTGAAPAGPARPLAPQAGCSGLEALALLADAMKRQHRRGGRSLLLIRDGRLHIGPGRSAPLAGGSDVVLDDGAGLVHVEASGVSQGNAAASGSSAIPPRTQYTVVLKGRPDLKPGDVVRVPKPIADAVTTPSSLVDALSGLAGALAGAAGPTGAPVRLYVSGVVHELSRTRGFSTTLSGVELGTDDGWDPVDTSAAGEASDPDPRSDPEGSFTSALRQWLGPASLPLGVGQVRAATAQGGAEPPSRTVDVWHGTVASDGLPFRARRLAIEQSAPSRSSGVPTLSPFAFGPCGLVVPRYPGTRVLLGYCGGAADDPIDLGAIWESGHGPDAEAGDWWLILPAAVPSSRRATLADTESAAEPVGAASNDLIDADGARTIEVGRFTVRVQPSGLAAAGTRPSPPADADEHVTIEHESGSRIVIAANGDITITAKGNLNLAVDKVLAISADSVTVQVAKTMDVS
jgi:hypothetical protein